MTRTRGLDGPATLLRVLLMHLVDGCSLRETASRARAGGLAAALHAGPEHARMRAGAGEIAARRRIAETLKRFVIGNGDVVMADHGLAHRRGIGHVVAHGADLIVRMGLDSIRLEDERGKEFTLMPRPGELKVG